MRFTSSCHKIGNYSKKGLTPDERAGVDALWHQLSPGKGKTVPVPAALMSKIRKLSVSPSLEPAIETGIEKFKGPRLVHLQTTGSYATLGAYANARLANFCRSEPLKVARTWAQCPDPSKRDPLPTRLDFGPEETFEARGIESRTLFAMGKQHHQLRGLHKLTIAL